MNKNQEKFKDKQFKEIYLESKQKNLTLLNYFGIDVDNFSLLNSIEIENKQENSEEKSNNIINNEQNNENNRDNEYLLSGFGLLHIIFKGIDFNLDNSKLYECELGSIHRLNANQLESLYIKYIIISNKIKHFISEFSRAFSEIVRNI